MIEPHLNPNQPVEIHVEGDALIEKRIAYLQINENIRRNSAEIKRRLTISQRLIAEPVALVGLGPSLEKTWPEIKKFRHIISTSGAHRFLIDRGIIPTWHVEVDYGAHKVNLIGPPHKTVKYLLASACHPALFQHLKDHEVTLWHPLLTPAKGMEDFPLIRPKEEMLINGGSNVLSRAMFIAHVLGYKNLEFFGLDYSYPNGHDGEHVIQHPTRLGKHQRLTLNGPDGTQYHTAQHLWDYAKEFFYLKRVLECHGMNFKVHGDGMIADLVTKGFTLDDGIKDHTKTPIAMIFHEDPVTAQR